MAGSSRLPRLFLFQEGISSSRITREQQGSYNKNKELGEHNVKKKDVVDHFTLNNNPFKTSSFLRGYQPGSFITQFVNLSLFLAWPTHPEAKHISR